MSRIREAFGAECAGEEDCDELSGKWRRDAGRFGRRGWVDEREAREDLYGSVTWQGEEESGLIEPELSFCCSLLAECPGRKIEAEIRSIEYFQQKDVMEC